MDSCVFCQGENIYKISKIDNWDKFQKMTTLEERHYKLYEESYKRIDRMYKADSLYLPTLSKKQKKYLYIQNELRGRLNYKENRARYFVEYIENDSIVVDKTFSLPDTLSTGCSCVISNDTLQILMGVWVFGGFFYKIKVVNNHYELVFIDDAHESTPFKYHEQDTAFVEDLELKVKNSSLIFGKKIKLKVGHKVKGYLRFESPVYFVESLFRGYSIDKKLDKSINKVEIYFTCKISEPIISDNNEKINDR